jgi:DNA-3-methyladenine glycosylase
MWKTGHSLIKQRMKETGAPFAGEMSGHMFFNEGFFGFDDALFAAGRLLRYVAGTGQRLDALVDSIPHYYATPEMRLECPDDRKFEVVAELGREFGGRYRDRPRRGPRGVRGRLGPGPRLQHAARHRRALRGAHAGTAGGDPPRVHGAAPSAGSRRGGGRALTVRRGDPVRAARSTGTVPRPPRPLPRVFYDRPVLRVAADVLGRLLVRDGPDGRVSGRIVEVEAYGGVADPASHAFRGRTPRNGVMFGPAGHLYVYFTYGMHHCANLVCRPGRHPAALLLRALEPVEGIALMRKRRGVSELHRLARGPGCLAQALALDLSDNGADLTRGPLWLADAPPARGGSRIARGPRVGIRLATERPWRFFLRGNLCVSAGPRLRARPGHDGGRRDPASGRATGHSPGGRSARGPR